MTGASRYVSDGTHQTVRWFCETLPDAGPGMRLVTLQTWTARGYQTETAEIEKPTPGMIVRLADAMIERLGVRDIAAAKRVAHLKRKAAVGAILLGLALGATGADAQTITRRSYDQHGREVGRAELRPDGSALYRDEHGYEVGRSERRTDGTARYYDRVGREVGSER